MGAKLTNQKSSKPKIVVDLKKDDINYAPVPFNQLLDGKVGKFTVKVEQMEEQLLTFLQEEAWLDLSDQQLLENGFSKTRDHPLLEDEHYLEGYFHGGIGNDPIKSLKPRDGQWMDKPAAPPRLRAFVQATKAKNEELLKGIAGAFPEGSAMKRLLDQVKYGESVAGGHLAYHVDTFNSVLHMAVAITGMRTLYLQHLEGDNVVKCASDLDPGLVYLSSPTAFTHAVGHGDLKRESRIVAVQCRIGMTPDHYQELFAEKDSLSVELENMSALIQVKELALPSLDEVMAAMDQIEK